jgi:hypothetical protein
MVPPNTGAAATLSTARDLAAEDMARHLRGFRPEFSLN